VRDESPGWTANGDGGGARQTKRFKFNSLVLIIISS
jgi:hypothetical protein